MARFVRIGHTTLRVVCMEWGNNTFIEVSFKAFPPQAIHRKVSSLPFHRPVPRKSIGEKNPFRGGCRLATSCTWVTSGAEPCESVR